uniref:hypothetical protein n=1 Tax=uncultured Allobacillus sp. TaxID=1638025 RepID=UPI0025955404|nr:hypothetical protein [uncultured Allobacillus sp.]
MTGDQRNFNNSGNASNVNLGDDSKLETTDTSQNIQQVSNKDLQELKEEIISLSDEKLREETELHYERFLKALHENEQSNIQKYWGWIKEAVGNTKTVLSIGASLGLL